MSGVSGAGWYEPLDWVLVRSPLLPIEQYVRLGDNPRAAADADFRRALAVASPSLFEQLERSPSGTSAARRRRQAILRYLIRMSTRATPYGLNAGASLAGWGDVTDLELADEQLPRARLDMGLIDALIRQLESRAEIVTALELRAHPLVWVRAGRAFLPERFSSDRGAFEVSVRASPPAVRVLELCRMRPRRFGELADALGHEFPAAGRDRIVSPSTGPGRASPTSCFQAACTTSWPPTRRSPVTWRHW